MMLPKVLCPRERESARWFMVKAVRWCCAKLCGMIFGPTKPARRALGVRDWNHFIITPFGPNLVRLSVHPLPVPLLCGWLIVCRQSFHRWLFVCFVCWGRIHTDLFDSISLFPPVTRAGRSVSSINHSWYSLRPSSFGGCVGYFTIDICGIFKV